MLADGGRLFRRPAAEQLAIDQSDCLPETGPHFSIRERVQTTSVIKLQNLNRYREQLNAVYTSWLAGSIDSIDRTGVLALKWPGTHFERTTLAPTVADVCSRARFVAADTAFNQTKTEA
jgi:hypothetical protein